jgi:hypothetical protein
VCSHASFVSDTMISRYDACCTFCRDDEMDVDCVALRRAAASLVIEWATLTCGWRFVSCVVRAVSRSVLKQPRFDGDLIRARLREQERDREGQCGRSSNAMHNPPLARTLPRTFPSAFISPSQHLCILHLRITHSISTFRAWHRSYSARRSKPKLKNLNPSRLPRCATRCRYLI